jgi:hypothetical protein
MYTPQRLGQTYLRDLYTELHELQDQYAKAMYYLAGIGIRPDAL